MIPPWEQRKPPTATLFDLGKPGQIAHAGHPQRNGWEPRTASTEWKAPSRDCSRKPRKRCWDPRGAPKAPHDYPKTPAVPCGTEAATESLPKLAAGPSERGAAATVPGGKEGTRPHAVEARELAFDDFADRVERMSDTEQSKVIATMVRSRTREKATMLSCDRASLEQYAQYFEGQLPRRDFHWTVVPEEVPMYDTPAAPFGLADIQSEIKVRAKGKAPGAGGLTMSC